MTRLFDDDAASQRNYLIGLKGVSVLARAPNSGHGCPVRTQRS